MKFFTNIKNIYENPTNEYEIHQNNIKRFWNIIQKNNNKNDYNNIKTCNVIIIDYIKRLDFLPKCIACRILLTKIVTFSFVNKFIKIKTNKIILKIDYFTRR